MDHVPQYQAVHVARLHYYFRFMAAPAILLHNIMVWREGDSEIHVKPGSGIIHEISTRLLGIAPLGKQ